ncbi:hypothetical protein PM082_006376 [Marasmius tenuissimus]|nr:hypothetical protein PM082_006376 [Marasmius tenuissimus]
MNPGRTHHSTSQTFYSPSTCSQLHVLKAFTLSSRDQYAKCPEFDRAVECNQTSSSCARLVLLNGTTELVHNVFLVAYIVSTSAIRNAN